MPFAGRVAVVTGASSGIGAALARALVAQGCKVGLVARRRERVEELARALDPSGKSTAFAAADVGDREQTRSAVDDLAGRLGPVDLLIANAGVALPTRLEPFSAADVEQVFRTNFFGVVYAVEAVLPGMLKRGRGHLAAVSSLGAYKGLPGSAAYCASKAAVNTFLEGLRIQLHGRGVAVTTLCPGFVRTPMTAPNPFRMPWILEPDEAARRIVRALGRRRKVYDFPWPTAMLMRLTRWLPDRFIARRLGHFTEARE